MGMPSMFSLSLFHPVIAVVILNAIKLIARKSSRASRMVDSGRAKFWSQLLSSVIIFVFTVIKNYQSQPPSFFGLLNVSSCNDSSIKAKFKHFIKTSHPDKTGVSSEDFSATKSMFEILKDPQKCTSYDIFGLEQGDIKKIPKTDREFFDHYLIESSIFYGFCLIFFIVLPYFSKSIDDLCESFLIITGAYCLELDGIFLHRNGIMGTVLGQLSIFLRPMSVGEIRSLIRSCVIPTLVLISNVRPIFFGDNPMSPQERREKLKYIYQTVKSLRMPSDAPHTLS